MSKVVILRHGESVWNKENRFTGWSGVDLSEKEIAEAGDAGRLPRDEGYAFDRSSFLGDPEEVERAMQALAARGEAKN